MPWPSCSRRRGCGGAAGCTRPTPARGCWRTRAPACCRCRARRTRANYREAGRQAARSRDYYTRDGNWAVLQPQLRDGIFFTQHNLATDGSFNEFHVIVCRDTLLAFNRTLHNRVHGRLYESLARFGFLCLGRKESLARTPHAAAYEELEGTRPRLPEGGMSPLGVLVVGAPRAAAAEVEALLALLPRELPVPVVLVLHRGPHDALAAPLGRRCALPVVEPDDKDDAAARPRVPGARGLPPAGGQGQRGPLRGAARARPAALPGRPLRVRRGRYGARAAGLLFTGHEDGCGGAGRCSRLAAAAWPWWARTGRAAVARRAGGAAVPGRP